MSEQHTPGHFQEMEEAFRRIDACLRACRGIPTAELEAGVAGPLATRLRSFIEKYQPAECPEAEEYDDTESAYHNGGDVTAWEMCQHLRQLIRMEPAPEPAPGDGV